MHRMRQEVKREVGANGIDGCMGPSVASGDVLEVRCLNRIFRWVPATDSTPEAIELEADPRHQQIIRKLPEVSSHPASSLHTIYQ